MGVNSFHHQAIKDIAPGLIITAVADDGTVEAMEDPTLPFFLAVQWHPEHYHRVDRTSAVIFRAFINACR
jgi:putative glutamine amidotransferase